MLRSYATKFELLAFESPIPPLLATRLYAPLVLHRPSRRQCLNVLSCSSHARPGRAGTSPTNNDKSASKQNDPIVLGHLSQSRPQETAINRRFSRHGQLHGQRPIACVLEDTRAEHGDAVTTSPLSRPNCELPNQQSENNLYPVASSHGMDNGASRKPFLPEPEREYQRTAEAPKDDQSLEAISHEKVAIASRRSLDSFSLDKARLVDPLRQPLELRPKEMNALALDLQKEKARADSEGSPLVVRPRVVVTWIPERGNERALTFSKDWNILVAELAAEFDARNTARSRKTWLPWKPVVARWAHYYRQRVTSLEDANLYWSEQHLHKRIKKWPNLMLWHLRYSPTKALHFLRGTFPAYLPPRQCVTDALDLITCQLVDERRPKSDPSQIWDLWKTFRTVTEQYECQPPFSQRSLRLVLETLPHKKLLIAHEFLHSKSIYVHFNTLLHIAHRLGGFGRTKAATNVLTQAVAAGAGVESSSVSRVSAKILSGSWGQDARYDRMSNSLASLSDLDIRLTLPMYNIMVHNAAQLQDVKTAWQIYDMIRANRMAPDEHTYSILFSLCRKTSDKKRYRNLYLQLNPEALPVINPYVLTEILLCRQHFNTKTNFDHVLRFYERHCDLQPLKDLHILPEEYTSRFADWYPQPRPKPSPATLTVMITAFIRSSSRIGEVAELLERFKHEVYVASNSAIVPLAATDHVYNAIMKGLDSTASFLKLRTDVTGSDVAVARPIHWTRILESMRRPLPDHILDPHTNAPYPPLKPTHHTWNIILNAQARAGNVDVTDQIMKLMKEQGVTPDIVSWNSLLSGASRRQDLETCAEVLATMKAEGISVNDETARALSHVRDRQKLLALLRDREEQKRRALLDRDGHEDGAESDDSASMQNGHGITPEEQEGPSIEEREEVGIEKGGSDQGLEGEWKD